MFQAQLRKIGKRTIDCTLYLSRVITFTAVQFIGGVCPKMVQTTKVFIEKQHIMNLL